MRAFLAANLSTAAVAQLVAQQRALRCAAEEMEMRVVWVAPENMHITLRFLGEIPEESGAALRATLSEALATWAPLSVVVRGAGAFPQRSRPRVLWLGVESADEALLRLADQVETAVVDLGFDPEPRPFHPHITLGRVKAGEGDPWTKRDPGPDVTSLVRELVLYRSERQRQGAGYTPVARIPLKERTT